MDFEAKRGAWGPVTFGFAAYIAFFLAGFFLGAPMLNTIGGVALVAIPVIGNYDTLLGFTGRGPFRWALLAICALATSFVVNTGSASFALTLKYTLSFVVFLEVWSWRLPPVNRCRWRTSLLILCLVPVFLSFFVDHYFVLGGERRLSGVFSNPNNLALVGLCPLFLINEHDTRTRRLAAHGLVILTLVLTNTIGAIVSYATALAYRLRTKWIRWWWAIGLAMAVAAATVVSVRAVVFDERFVRQYEAICDNLEMALRSGEVEYGQVAAQYGESATSGVWRIATWSRIVSKFVAAGPTAWILGCGLGSSAELFGSLPHNEYFRVLVETGFLGLLCYAGFFVAAWLALKPDDRHVLILFLLYSFTENNLDNFLFMAVMMLFLGSAARRRGPDLHASASAEI